MRTAEEIKEVLDEMLSKHPEYTLDQKVCAEYAAKYKKACEVSQERVRQKKAYNSFTVENPTMVGVSERALRPLINEQDPDVRAEAVQKVGAGLLRGHSMGAENIKRIVEEIKEGKVKSGRPAKSPTAVVTEQVKEVKDEDEEELDLPCASCTHISIPEDEELEYESVEEKLKLFVEYLLSLGLKGGEIRTKFLKVLDEFC